MAFRPARRAAVVPVLALILLAHAHTTVSAQSQATVLKAVSGVLPNGRATDKWLEMVRRRLPSDRYDSVARIRRPLTTREKGWTRLIESRLEAWQAMTPALAELITPVAPPPNVLIVLGNRGAEDAFTHDARTIGFDLAALRSSYGDPASRANTDRIDRFFRHEYVHLLQKAWLAEHPWAADTPLRMALLDVWSEGMGNYYSLTSRWMTRAGRRSERANRALAELEPRFVARIAAAACATPEAAERLLTGLSAGKFDQKWGALPAALWLEAEMASDSAAIRQFLAAGPAGVWELADRHLPPTLRTALREARTASSLCAGG